jgi:histone demethylase JARID1
LRAVCIPNRVCNTPDANCLGTRANLNYLDQLAKFHKQHGHSLTRFPSVDKRPLDLFKLKKAVETRGGFERVCKQKKWAEIGRDLGYRAR